MEGQPLRELSIPGVLLGGVNIIALRPLLAFCPNTPFVFGECRLGDGEGDLGTEWGHRESQSLATRGYHLLL